MADDDEDKDMWDDDEFLQKVIQATEAAVSSQQQQQRLLFRPPPAISYSPPRQLSQRLNNPHSDNRPKEMEIKVFNNVPHQHKLKNSLEYTTNNHGFTPSLRHETTSFDGHMTGSRINREGSCSKQQEIDRLKHELGRVSNMLTDLEQECSELKKDREKSEEHLRLLLPVNGSKDALAICTNKSNLNNKDPIEEHSLIPVTKGAIPCKGVGVQTDEHVLVTDLTIEKSLCVSRKLAGIWEPLSHQQPRVNLVSKLFVACEADLQFLFECLGLNMPSTKATFTMTPNHCIQPVEAEKVSHLYLTLTKTSYDMGGLDDLIEALVDLCCLQNTMIVHRSLCILHVVLKHILSIENRLCGRDNVIVNDPSVVNRSSGKHADIEYLLHESTNKTSKAQHSVLTRLTSAEKIWNKDSLRGESSPLISCPKWLSLYQYMHQIITKHSEESLRMEAVSIMNILLLRADAYAEREMYGEVSVFQSISQLLRKESGIGVQKQTVHLLYLLLNCPNLMSMFCPSTKGEGATADAPATNAETASAFQGLDAIIDSLADCLVCRGNGAPTTMVLKLQRNTITLLAFLASSGSHGFELLLGRSLSRRTNFLHMILQVLASEIDVESSECIQPSDDFRERTLLIREALILLNRLASNSQYSTPVLRVLTKRRDMAILTIDIASRLSRKDKWLQQSDTMTRQTRESEIADLARIFKKKVFNFLGDTTPEK